MNEEYQQGVKDLAERLNLKVRCMKCKASLPSGTVTKERLLEWANWLLHTVIPKTIDEVTKELIDDD